MSGDCDIYKDLLVEEALGEIGEKERAFLKAHLAGCSKCRSELAALGDVIGAMKREHPVAAPAGLAERSFHRIGATGERMLNAAASFEGTSVLHPSTWQIRKSLVAWMVAASLLVMALAPLVPEMVGTADKRAEAACQGNLRILGTALRQYALDHDGAYPRGEGWHRKLDYEHLRGLGAFTCPGRLAIGKSSEAEVDYVYNPGRVSIHSGHDYPLLWDRNAAHDRLGRNVLFADGSVRWLEEDEFQAFLAKFKIDEAEAIY